MTIIDRPFDRRTILKGSATALGAAAASGLPFGSEFAAGFPTATSA